MNEVLSETETAESYSEIDAKDVNEIISSIKEAQYFDASSMAPLTSAALVSLSYVLGTYLIE